MDNQKPTMTRGQYKKQHRPFYKKAPFIITLIIILIAIILGIVFWAIGHADKEEASSDNQRVENVSPKTDKNSSQNETKPADSQSVKKDKDDAKPKESKKTYTDPGSYDNLDYKSDDFEFKISNDVKLVKDIDGNSAILIKYTYTNKTDKEQIAQKVQAANMILKQDNQELTPTGGDGDYSQLVSEANAKPVQPNQKLDGALLLKVNNDTSDVNMYFMNLQTHQYLNTMQPFKLA